MKQYPNARQTIDPSDVEAVTAALQSDKLTRGPLVESFERAVAEYCGALHAVAFSSGTTALSAAFVAAEVGPADRLLTTPNTYIGGVAGAVQRGAQLELLDIDPKTGNLQIPDQLPEAPSRGRTILVPVHYGGTPLDMERLESRIVEPDAVVIEDACGALGGTYRSGERIGCCRWSQMTLFSFHPAKTITTGEGGMVLTNSEELADRLRWARNNGIEPGSLPLSHTLSTNGHLTEMGAALGLSQLKRIPTLLRKRRLLVKGYRQELSELPHIELLDDALDGHACPTLMPVRVTQNRDAIAARLLEEGIETARHYLPLYRHPALPNLPSLPNMESFFAQVMTLPLYVEMSRADVKSITSAIRMILQPD